MLPTILFWRNITSSILCSAGASYSLCPHWSFFVPFTNSCWVRHYSVLYRFPSETETSYFDKLIGCSFGTWFCLLTLLLSTCLLRNGYFPILAHWLCLTFSLVRSLRGKLLRHFLAVYSFFCKAGAARIAFIFIMILLRTSQNCTSFLRQWRFCCFRVVRLYCVRRLPLLWVEGAHDHSFTSLINFYFLCFLVRWFCKP